jgi:hypothetical protein
MKNGNYIIKIIEDSFEDSDHKISKIMITNDLYFNERLNYKAKFQLNINTGTCLILPKIELESLKHFINYKINKINLNIFLHEDYVACNVNNGSHVVKTCENIRGETIGISISFIN